MVDPAGRFFDSSAGGYTYSQPILKVGVRAALKDVTIDVDRFERRGGVYNWREDGMHVEETMTMAGGLAR
jgi:radical S-adenosyl methionine domain-containing protein 2